MPDKVLPGPVEGPGGIREAVCIHTKKVFDACKDRDCMEDLRFYPKKQCLDTIDRCLSVKGGTAKLLYVYVDVEPVSFNRGFYSVDMRFFYAVTLQAYLASPAPVSIEGLCVFDKRAILFGSEGSAKIFSSEARMGEPDLQLLQKTNLPTAVVEAVEPLVLDARVTDQCCCSEVELCEVPRFVSDCFGGDLTAGGCGKRIYVTLGQFSIVRLERDTQLLIPVYDYCMPEKECSCGVNPSEDPCGIFRSICFPAGEFFPPNTISAPTPENYESARCCFGR